MSQQKDYAGEYYLKGVMETAAGIKLNEDSTFEFFYSYGAADRQGSGSWIIKENKIILTSIRKPGNYFRLLKHEIQPGEKITVKVTDPNADALRFVHTGILNGDKFIQGEVDNTGKAVFEKQPYDSIALMFAMSPENTMFYKPSKAGENYFEFAIEPWIMEVIFDNTEFKIDSEKMIGQHLIFGEEDVFFEKHKK